MSVTALTPEVIARRGEDLFEKQIKHRVDASNRGKFLVIDVETGDYEIDEDDLVAFRRADERHPDGLFYIMRLGFGAAHRLGGRFGSDAL